jgi:hypothetical protein
MVFSSTNWNVPQTVKVTGVDDNYKDGTTAYTITVSVKETEDMEYKDFVKYLDATNADNDVPGFTVAPTTLAVDEKGMTKTFTIVLNSRPSSDVIVELTPDNTKAAEVSPTSISFTPDNWNVPQEAVVTGLHDKTTTTDTSLKVRAKIGLGVYDLDYAALDTDDVSVTSKNINLPSPTADDAVAKVNLTAASVVSATIDVLANDTDLTETGADGKAFLKIDSVTIDPTYGTAEVVDGKIKYTSSTDFIGTATFSYTVKDSDGYTAVGVVTVEVTEIILPAFPKSENGLSALISPSDGSTVGSKPTFVWEPTLTNTGSLPIAYYEITLEPLPTGVTAPLTSTTTPYTPPFMLPAGVYTWTIEAVDVDGNRSGKVEPSAKFTAKKTGGVSYLPIIFKK